MARQFARREWKLVAWSGNFFDEAALTGTQSVISSMLAPTGVGAARQTLLRTRGSLVVLGTPDAAGDSEIVGLGVIVVQQAAAAVGGASVPGPLNDPDANWLWHQFVGLNAMGATGETPTSVSAIVRVEIDSKAMRKVAIDQELIMIGELATGEFASVIVTGGWRVLMQH